MYDLTPLQQVAVGVTASVILSVLGQWWFARRGQRGNAYVFANVACVVAGIAALMNVYAASKGTLIGLHVGFVCLFGVICANSLRLSRKYRPPVAS